MPMLEHQSIKVTLTIEVDGHAFNFEKSGKTIGARYHGMDPRADGYDKDDSLEARILSTVDHYVSEVSDRAEQFLSRAYPVVEADAE